MDAVLPGFERELEGVSYSAPTITLISNLTAQAAGLDVLGRASYWRDHLRRPVRFAESIQVLANLGITHYIEMSPHPVLLGMGADCVSGATWLPSLRKEQAAFGEVLRSLQALYADGLNVDWASVEREQPHRRVSLPTYPFQRKRHWIDAISSAASPRAGLDLWTAATRALDREAERGPFDLNRASYPRQVAHLARLTDAQIWHTLRELGAFKNQASGTTVDSLVERAASWPVIAD